MLSRRAFLAGLSASLPVAAPLVTMPGAARAQARPPRLHAMVVGINSYGGRDRLGPIKPLRGCLNDAEDIERQVLRLQPAFFRRLGWDRQAKAERPVTRTGFFAAWREMLAAAAPGDTMLLTFSGHGSQIPVLPGNPSNEADGYDETLVLSGYTLSDGRNAEHIIDDEIGELVLAAHAKGVIVVLVSDSCHSGTVYRAVEMRDVSYRTLAANPAAAIAPPAPAFSAPPPAPPNLLFLAASQDDELVPEISVNGQYRGALSVAVARALEGEAASDGVITAYGLARFVLGRVRDLSDGGQHPDIIQPGRIQTDASAATKATPAGVLGVRKDTPLLVLSGGRADTPAISRPLATAGPVRLRIIGASAAEQQRLASSLQRAVLAGEGEAAALIWDAERRLILNDQRHRVAENVGAGGLQHAIDRRLALDQLIPMAANGLDVRILAGGKETPASDAAHKPGDAISIQVSGVGDDGYVAVFNFTGTGLVQILAPTPYHRPDPRRADFTPAAFRTGTQPVRSDLDLGGVDVREPFGADHVIAVAGALPLRRLMPALVEAHERLAIGAVMAALAAELEAQPLKVGFRGIYTERG